MSNFAAQETSLESRRYYVDSVKISKMRSMIRNDEY